MHVCSALDASLKASLKDPLWKVNSITASWQEEEGTAEEMVGMAMLLLSDAPPPPHPPLSPSFNDKGPSLFPKLINKASHSTKTLAMVGVTAKDVILCVFDQFVFFCDSGPVPVLVMSLLFIASVFMLHIWGKYTRS